MRAGCCRRQTRPDSANHPKAAGLLRSAREGPPGRLRDEFQSRHIRLAARSPARKATPRADTRCPRARCAGSAASSANDEIARVAKSCRRYARAASDTARAWKLRQSLRTRAKACRLAFEKASADAAVRAEYRCSRVTGVLMLWQEEGVQDHIHLQQGITIQNETIALPGKHPAAFQFRELLVEAFRDFHAEFPAE